jgi:hypothetical protein
MTLEIHVLSCDRHTNVAGMNRLMGPQTFPHDNWISNSNAYRKKERKKERKKYKQAIKKICKNSLPLKKTTCTCITKMNDNINMDSTIAGSMNDNINMDSTIAGSMNTRS